MIFAYTNENGGVSIITAAPKAHLEELLGAAMSHDDLRMHVLGRNFPDGKLPADLIELPADWKQPPRETRSRWKIVGGKIAVV